MTVAEYFWNVYQHRVDAQVFGETVETLASDGTVTPPRVVEAARPESSPIHDAFEWDDVVAGEAWRIICWTMRRFCVVCNADVP